MFTFCTMTTNVQFPSPLNANRSAIIEVKINVCRISCVSHKLLIRNKAKTNTITVRVAFYIILRSLFVNCRNLVPLIYINENTCKY